MSDLIDEANKWLTDYGQGYQEFAGGPTHDCLGKELIEALRDALEAAEAESKLLVAMLAAAKDEARKEGYVPVADYEIRERIWRGYEGQLKRERDEALAKLARVEAVAEAEKHWNEECGWDVPAIRVLAALDGAPEPEVKP